MENPTDAASQHGADTYFGEPLYRENGTSGPPHTGLTDHVAVTNHGKGVGSDNLANFIECFADYGRGRILRTGRLQYELGETGEQRFETLTAPELCDELLDELSDASNYIGMLAIKVLVMRNALSEGA